tara:strand:+ start:824 stop:1045 length:222 start_codon:yes stop_codon:yes gene_type:complete
MARIRRKNSVHAHINRSYRNVLGRKGAKCELSDPYTGEFLGTWHGTEDQLMGCNCPCPGGGACLPACCDLHEF